MKRLTLILLLALPLVAQDRRHSVQPPEAPPDCSFMAAVNGIAPNKDPDNLKASEWAKGLNAPLLQCRGDLIRKAYAYLTAAMQCRAMTPAPGFIENYCSAHCPYLDVLGWFWANGIDFPKVGVSHTFCVHRPAELAGRHAWVSAMFLGRPVSIEVVDDSCTDCEVYFEAPMVHDTEPVWEWHAQ